MYCIVIIIGFENWKCIFFYFYLKYGLSVLFIMYVVFVFFDVYVLVILELGNIFLNRELNVFVVVNGILLLIIVMVIFIFVEVIFESINMDYFSWLIYIRYCVKCIVVLK